MNGIQKIRMDFSDEELQFRVKSFLHSRHFPGFENIEVGVENGAVTLHGALSSFYEKQVALSSCQRVAGVITLVDKIAVKPRPMALSVG